MQKIIFITGVSSGFGKELLQQAAAAGYTVAGTVRKKEQLGEINNIKPGKTFGYLLDVNDHKRVFTTIKEVAEKFGRLDVVINNAGYGLMGAVEEVSMEEARQQMETNFFSALAVTQPQFHTCVNKAAGTSFNFHQLPVYSQPLALVSIMPVSLPLKV